MRSLSVQAQERKEALRKIPEQFILSEVRRMVEEMQNVNKKIDEIVSNEILDTFILFYWIVGLFRLFLWFQYYNVDVIVNIMSNPTNYLPVFYISWVSL